MMKLRISTIPVLILTLVLASWPVFTLRALGQGQRAEQEPQRPDTIKVTTALVTVPVVVTDRYGQFVTGLSQNDFRLQENGEPQQIASFSSTEAPFNVALLIDTSRSTRNKLGAIRKAALNFVKQLQPNDRVLIVTFDEKVNFLGDFTSDRREIEREIHSVKSSYLTSLYDAVHLTITEKFAPIKGRKAIVALTDGEDTWSRKATYESTLELVANAGVSAYTIQYDTRNDGGSPMSPLYLPRMPNNYLFSRLVQGDAQARNRQARDRYLIASEYLRAVAAQSGALYFRAESIESSSYAFALIANELRQQYTLSYYPINDKRDGGFRKIAVSVKSGDFLVRARQGYRAPKDEKTLTSPTDKSAQSLSRSDADRVPPSERSRFIGRRRSARALYSGLGGPY
jgi:Ca-activated chloride channel homolog